MIPIEELESVRTVNISQDTATVVSNDPVGDERTLFPLQTALGYNISQSLFIGNKNLVVEGVSDYWYLSSVSEYLNDDSGTGLPGDLVLTPAGGAPKITYMVTLLASHRLKVIILFDEEPQARKTAEDLVKSKLIRNDNVVFISDGFTPLLSGEADVEDLLDPEVFHTLIMDSYSKELAGKTLPLNIQIPRIAKRYEDAFKALNIPYHKTRPARLFLQRIGENPNSVLPLSSRERFERLYQVISARLQAQLKRDDEPFRS